MSLHVPLMEERYEKTWNDWSCLSGSSTRRGVPGLGLWRTRRWRPWWWRWFSRWRRRLSWRHARRRLPWRHGWRWIPRWRCTLRWRRLQGWIRPRIRRWLRLRRIWWLWRLRIWTGHRGRSNRWIAPWWRYRIRRLLRRLLRLLQLLLWLLKRLSLKAKKAAFFGLPFSFQSNSHSSACLPRRVRDQYAHKALSFVHVRRLNFGSPYPAQASMNSRRLSSASLRR